MSIKRFIALLLISSLSLLQIQVLASDTETDTKYGQDISIMSSLGFVKVIPAGDENAAVTKGMFAAAIVSLMGAKLGTAEYTSPFVDVNSSTAFHNEIAYAASCGIAHGEENSKFEPDSGITYREALAMLVNALGYYDYAVSEGGYPGGFMKIASDIGLTKGVSVSETTRLTAGMCARLLLNAGETNVATIIPTASGMKIEKGDTLFWEKHNIAKDSGILEANTYTSVNSANGVGKNRIKIAGNIASVYYSNESMDYLGYNVEYYYRSNDGDLTVLYMIPKKTEVTVVDADDIYDYSNDTLSYSQNNSAKELEISRATPIIYNGVYTNTYYLENGKSIFTPGNGEVKFIDNNSDERADVISIIDYTDVVVSAVNINEDVIYDKYNSQFVLDFTDKDSADDEMWIITDVSGNIVAYNDVKEKDVMSVMLSMDKKIMRGVISRESVKGQLSSFSTVDGVTVAIVDGVEYEVANDSIANIPSAGENVTLYLDFNGKVADMVSETASVSGYAFVMRKYYNDVDESYYLKLLLADGTKKDLAISEKVKIDGEIYKDDGLKIYMESFSDYQVVIVKKNANEEITAIDTLVSDKGGNSDSLRSFADAPATMGYFSTMGSFSGKMITTAKTVVFRTPSEASKSEYDLYSVGSLPDGTNVKLTVRGYCSDPESFTADCIQYVSDNAAGFGSSSPYMVISDIADTIGKDDEVVKKISGFDQNGPVSIVVDPDYTPGTYGVAISTLNVGDVIKYSRNERGELACASPVHKIGTTVPGKFVEDFYQDIFWNSRTEAFGRADFFSYVGYLLAKEDRTIALVENTTDLTDTNLKPEIMFKTVDSTKVYYVSKGRKVTVEAVSSQNLSYMSDYKNTRREQQVLVITSNGEPRMMVVYE